MRRKRFNVVSAAILTACLSLGLLPIGVLNVRADDSAGYITELQIVSGADALQKLEEAGYTPIEQSLNPIRAGDESSFVYMGYKTGAASGAITDIRVGSGSSLNIDGSSYSKVSDIGLNNGAGGSDIYLYVSYDKAAGESLRGISFQVVKSDDGFESGDKLLASDGSEIVRTDQNEIADFDEGISDSELYLKMYKGNIYRPYIDDVVAVKASDEKQAMRKLASKGCTYYLNYAVEGADSDVYLGYTRNSDEEEALKSLIAVPNNEDEIVVKDVTYQRVKGSGNEALDDYSLYQTKDEAAGDPIMDLVAYGYGPEDTDIEIEEKPKEEINEPKEETNEEPPNEINEEPKQDNNEEPKEELNEEPPTDPENEAPPDEPPADNPDNEVSENEVIAPNMRGAAAPPEEETPQAGDEQTPEVGGGEETGGAASDGDTSQQEDTDTKEEVQEPQETKPDNTEETGSPGNDNPDEEVNSDNPKNEDDADAEEDKEDKEDEEEDKEDEGEIIYAPGIRVYKEIATKDYISQYYLRGGDVAAVKFLYDESEYQEAANSEKTLWISNIYCSDRDGKQFINNVGYVSAGDTAVNSPFEMVYGLLDNSAQTTASVMDDGASTKRMVLVVGIVAAAVVSGAVIRRKNRK